MKYDVDVNVYLRVEAENAEEATQRAMDSLAPEFRKSMPYRVVVTNSESTTIEDYEITNVHRHGVLIAD